MAAMTNAERQARWRAKRDLLARQAEVPAGATIVLERLTPEALEAMDTQTLKDLDRECTRVHRMALEQLAARRRPAAR
jgi:hypothetical protein